MLTRELNETLTRTGPDTPMGNLFRRFWIPALLAAEVAEKDGPPVRVKLLGEELVAFRNSEGRVGLVEARCPHRGASLFFGRNEECGIRCAYHGWKFDLDGNCLDIPTMPRDNAAYDPLLSRVKIAAYPTREYGGYIWAYLGPRELMPDMPLMEFAEVPPAHRFITKKLQECNWAQAAEGGIDTAHFSFLHAPVGQGADSLSTMTRGYSPRTMGQDQVRWMVNDGRPRYTVEKHDSGLVLAGARNADGGDLYWRIAQYLLPSHSFTPGTAKGETYHGNTWMPIDDENCWIYTFSWNPDRPLSDEERTAYANGASIHAEVDSEWMPLRKRSNDYLIDRDMQKRINYSGIKGISEQDQAIQDSQGRIHDRTREILGPTDLGIARFRTLMLEAARDLAAGIEPAAAKLPSAYFVRSGAIVTPADMPFHEVMMRRFGHPDGRIDLAEARAAE